MNKRAFKSRSALVLLLLLAGIALLLTSLAHTTSNRADAITLNTLPITIPHISTIFIPQPAPQVISENPANGDTNVTVTPVIWAQFNTAMDPSTITSTNVILAKVPSGSVPSYWVSYDSTGHTAYITLNGGSSLDPGSIYSVTVKGAVKNSGGVTMGADFVWTFATSSSTTTASTTTTTEVSTTTTSSSTTTTTAPSTTSTTLPAAPSFSDIATSPYQTAIEGVAARGIVSGFTDGTFRPGDTVKRQQFAKAIVLSLGLHVSLSDICPFPDVPSGLDPNDPFYPNNYVAVCAAHGITQGLTPTTFAPYDPIKRFQLITMVVRGLNDRYPGLLQTPPANYPSTWNPNLSPQHGQNARLAEYNGLLAGLPLASLNPFDPMPRGEVAQLLWNMVQLIEH